MAKDMRGLWAGLYPPGVSSLLPPDVDSTTYQLAAAWLDVDDWSVEDWGGGAGWAGQFFTHARYQVVDGSIGVMRDLQAYRSDVDGILLRHVLEHNHNWQGILANALASIRHRLVLVIFTPWSSGPTCQIATNWAGIPDLSFNKDELLAHCHELFVKEESLPTRTQYHTETVLYFECRAMMG